MARICYCYTPGPVVFRAIERKPPRTATFPSTVGGNIFFHCGSSCHGSYHPVQLPEKFSLLTLIFSRKKKYYYLPTREQFLFDESWRKLYKIPQAWVLEGCFHILPFRCHVLLNVSLYSPLQSFGRILKLRSPNACSAPEFPACLIKWKNET